MGEWENILNPPLEELEERKEMMVSAAGSFRAALACQDNNSCRVS